MIELSETRKKIDAVDRQIVALFEERMRLGSDVAEYKRAVGKPILDKEREAEKIRTMQELATTDFNKKAVAELFHQLMSLSRKYQYTLIGEEKSDIEKQFEMVEQLPMEEKMNIVYQGVQGAYSEQCVCQYFGENVTRFHVEQFKDVMEVLERGEATYGVLPIENSFAGTVSGIYDLLTQYEDLCIVGEEIVKVEHALLGSEDATCDTIQDVYSHPQGIMQSQAYLEKHGFQAHEVSNTAKAAKMVASFHDKTKGAIASEKAGELYGLKIIEKSINTERENSTRFIILRKGRMYRKDAKKITISFSLPHETGSLYEILSNVIHNDLNMTRIESRPLENHPWKYRFFVDFVGNLMEPAVKNACTAIDKEAIDFKVLGNY
ncbi:MAG TPA: prephenate dehydratase [Candidatus Scybalomonas excrementigallinarum]|nr:prephenate dehydratase [Candidatus Scybalomonas excrementigallinarum]